MGIVPGDSEPLLFTLEHWVSAASKPQVGFQSRNVWQGQSISLSSLVRMFLLEVERLTGCVGWVCGTSSPKYSQDVRGEMVARHSGRYLTGIFEDASVSNLCSLWCNLGTEVLRNSLMTVRVIS